MRSEVVQRSGEVIMIRDLKYNEKNHQTYISSEIQIPQYQIDLGLVQVQCHSALVLGFDSNSASSLGDIVAAVLATMTGRFSGKEIYTVLITLTPNHLSGSFTLLDTSKSGMAKQVVHRLHSGEDSGG